MRMQQQLKNVYGLSPKNIRAEAFFIYHIIILHIMKQIFIKIGLLAKNYWLFILLCIIVLVLLQILLYAGKQVKEWFWPREVISALLGAATVAGITYLLLKGQANNESAVEQKKKVFENRLKAYESFMTTLRKVVVSNQVDERSEKLLQFGIANIGMHANSEDMLIVSKNLKFILQKIKVKEHADGSIWNELMEIVNVFHRSLYVNDERVLDSNMHKALRNFSGLCVDEDYEVLEFIECLLSSHRFDSFIAGKCLFYSIPVKKQFIKHNGLPRRIYVTIRIDETQVEEPENLYSGIVAIYCKKGYFNVLSNLFDDPKLWLAPKDKVKLQLEQNLELGVNIVGEAYVLHFQELKKMALQSVVCDIFNFMHPIWAGNGVAYLRKDQEGILKREIPSEKK